jgi:hypothetical protein
MSLKTSKTGGYTGEKEIEKIKSDSHIANSTKGADKKVKGSDGRFSPKNTISTNQVVKNSSPEYFIRACYNHLSRNYK